MAELSFETIGGATGYPQATYDSQTNQSYGFVNPNQIQSGGMRGTQIITSTDGSKILLGNLPNSTDFGIAFYDPTGNMVGKIVGGTYFFYNPVDSYRNSIRIGNAPGDKRTGIWTAKTGNDVTTLLGG